MREKLRCGVIGTGGCGWDHLRYLAECSRAATVAIAESHPQRARETADRFHVSRIYSDYRELLDQPDIEAVCICLPNVLHAPVATEALQARKHVLLEEPLALTSKEAARVIATAQKFKRTLMLAHPMRFHRHTQAAKACIAHGDLGEVYHTRAFAHRHSGIPRIGSWFTQKAAAGGGCALDLGLHLVDLSCHLLDEFEVISVSAQTFAKFGPRGRGDGTWGKSEIAPNRPCDVEDCSVALLRFKSGHTVSVETTWAGFHPSDGRETGVDLLGTDAGMSLFPARMFRNNNSGYETTYLQVPKLPQPEDCVQYFVQCVLDGRKPSVTPEQSLRLLEVVEAMYQSAGSGKEVRLK